MEIRIYFVDGSTSYRDHIIDIEDRDGQIHTIDTEGFEMAYEHEHIAMISLTSRNSDELNKIRTRTPDYREAFELIQKEAVPGGHAWSITYDKSHKEYIATVIKNR